MKLAPAHIGRAMLAERIALFLRGKIGRGAGKASVHRIADELAVDPRTLQAWTYGEACPDAVGLVRLASHYGVAFADALLEPAGLVTAPLDGSDGEAAARARAALGTLEKRLHELADVASGGASRAGAEPPDGQRSFKLKAVTK